MIAGFIDDATSDEYGVYIINFYATEYRFRVSKKFQPRRTRKVHYRVLWDTLALLNECVDDRESSAKGRESQNSIGGIDGI